jgi:predicted MPP superfamily phosphohydrolase
MSRHCSQPTSCYHAHELAAAGAFVLLLVLTGAASAYVVIRAVFSLGGAFPEILDSTGARATASVMCVFYLALGVWVRFVEPRRLGVTRLELTSPKLTRRMRVAFLSDLHAELFWPMRGRVAPAVAGQSPDLILFGGDFLNSGSRHAKARLAAEMTQLSAVAPMIAVEGNADYYHEGGREIMQAAGARFLSAGRADLDAGVSVWGVDFLDRDAIQAAGKELDTGRFNICLTHEPSLMPDAAEAGFDLLLAGHTHGGQIRLPWVGGLVTMAHLSYRVQMGRYRYGALTGYVGRGIGLERGVVARGRLLCPPEVVIFDLLPGAGSGA